MSGETDQALRTIQALLMAHFAWWLLLSRHQPSPVAERQKRIGNLLGRRLDRAWVRASPRTRGIRLLAWADLRVRRRNDCCNYDRSRFGR
jgi:hypothetical protein